VCPKYCPVLEPRNRKSSQRRDALHPGGGPVTRIGKSSARAIGVFWSSPDFPLGKSGFVVRELVGILGKSFMFASALCETAVSRSVWSREGTNSEPSPETVW
jgi:hypothetical protein